MGIGQRITAMGRNPFSKRRTSRPEGVKSVPGSSVVQSEASTGGEGSLDSMGSLELNGDNFPVRVTEYINHTACYITIDTTRHGSRLIGHDEPVCAETQRASRVITEQVFVEEGSICLEEVRDVIEVETTSARALKQRERLAEDCNARTSVDCQLDECVLTMDRANIYPELTYLTRPMIGRWETSLEMSDPLDPLFKACGISYVKRFVVDKLALQIELGYSENSRFFELDLQIPFGNRKMKWDLRGESYQDNDPDCGLWDGHVNVVKFNVGSICPEGSKAESFMQAVIDELPQGADTEIFAPCQVRTHATIGVVHETRFSLPSKKYGKLLFLKYVLYPKNKGKEVTVMRCLTPLSQ